MRYAVPIYVAIFLCLIWQFHNTVGINQPKHEMEKTMTNSNKKPTYRLMCARIEGQDSKGREQLGPFREIGAAWQPRDGKKWLPLPIDLMPIELTQGRAVLFLAPVDNTNI